MAVYSVNPKTSALLIIDAQNEYFSEDGKLYTPNAEKIRPNLVALRDAAKFSGTLTVVVKHVHRASGVDVGRMGDFDDTEVFVHGTFGTDLIDEFADAEVVVEKRRYSSFVSTDLDSILRGNGIDTIIISGLMTQYCSVTTARHAHDLDYRVIFVGDANAGPDLPDLGYGEVSHELALRVVLTMLAIGVADIQSTKDVVTGLRAGLK